MKWRRTQPNWVFSSDAYFACGKFFGAIDADLSAKLEARVGFGWLFKHRYKASNIDENLPEEVRSVSCAFNQR